MGFWKQLKEQFDAFAGRATDSGAVGPAQSWANYQEARAIARYIQETAIRKPPVRRLTRP